MFHLLRLIVWLAGFFVVTHFALGYFGYEFNLEYFSQSKTRCQELLDQCKNNLIRQGLDNVKCEYQCVDPKLIIQKKPL